MTRRSRYTDRLRFVREALASVEDRVDAAAMALADARAGYPTSVRAQPGSSSHGHGTSATERAALAGDPASAELDELEKLTKRLADEAARVARVVNRWAPTGAQLERLAEAQADPAVLDGSPDVCGNVWCHQTIAPDARAKRYRGAGPWLCPRCYAHKRRHGTEWRPERPRA